MTAVSHTEESSAAAASAAMSNSTDARYTKEADNPASVSAHTTSHTNESPGEYRDVVKGVNTAWLAIHWSIFGIVLYCFCFEFIQPLFSNECFIFSTYSSKYFAHKQFFDYVKHVVFEFAMDLKNMALIVQPKEDGYKTNNFGITKNYCIFTLLPAVACSLLILCGPNRELRTKWFAVPMLLSLVPLIHSTVLLCIVSVPSYSICDRLCYCILNFGILATYTCCAVGLFLNGRPVAAHLMPYYHIKVSQTQRSD